MAYYKILRMRAVVRCYPGLTLSKLAVRMRINERTAASYLKAWGEIGDIKQYKAPWFSPHGGHPMVYVAVHAPTPHDIKEADWEILTDEHRADARACSDSCLKDFKERGMQLART